MLALTALLIDLVALIAFGCFVVELVLVANFGTNFFFWIYYSNSTIFSSYDLGGIYKD